MPIPSLPRRLPARSAVADRFQVHAGAGEGPAVAGPRRDPCARGRPAQTQLAQAASPTAAVNALTPTGYNLGVAVGWRRFAVAGDVAKVKSADPALGGRESAVLGVSYSLKQPVEHRVAVGADRADRQPGAGASPGRQCSLDVGSSYSLSRHIALTGGVRYNVERDRLSRSRTTAATARRCTSAPRSSSERRNPGPTDESPAARSSETSRVHAAESNGPASANRASVPARMRGAAASRDGCSSDRPAKAGASASAAAALECSSRML